jgi:hypothetical protein
MTRMKILSAALVVSAAIASPVFAGGREGGGPIGPGSSNGLTPQPGRFITKAGPIIVEPITNGTGTTSLNAIEKTWGLVAAIAHRRGLVRHMAVSS